MQSKAAFRLGEYLINLLISKVSLKISIAALINQWFKQQILLLLKSSFHLNTEDMATTSVTCKELVAKRQAISIDMRSAEPAPTANACLTQQPSLVYHVCDRCNYNSWYNVFLHHT